MKYVAIVSEQLRICVLESVDEDDLCPQYIGPEKGGFLLLINSLISGHSYGIICS